MFCRKRQQSVCTSSEWDDDDDDDYGEDDDDDHNDDEDDDDAMGSVPEHLMSSGSTENLQMELSRCISDGLSDKENIIRQMKYHVKHSADRLMEVGSTITQSLNHPHSKAMNCCRM